MDKLLRPERLDLLPNSENAAKHWRHWLKTFENFLAELEPDHANLNKLRVLTNYVSSEVYELFSELQTYDEAIALLKTLYDKSPNEIYARHALASRKQLPNETLDEYLQVLKVMSKDCNYRPVTAAQYRDEAIRDAFISGLLCHSIRQRLLENDNLNLELAFNQARAMESAKRSSESYGISQLSSNLTTATVVTENESRGKLSEKFISAAANQKCYFCGLKYHPRSQCPAKKAICNRCLKIGHYQRVCQAKSALLRKSSATSAALQTESRVLLRASLIPDGLTKSCLPVEVNGEIVEALIDSGSTDNFIHPRHVERCALKVHDGFETVSMASSSSNKKLAGHCVATISVQGNIYDQVKLYVFPDLCADIILGQDWQSKHSSVTIEYGGLQPPLKICNLTALNVDPPPLFEYLSTDCKPIAAPSRKYSQEDRTFIESEIKRMLSEGIIEPSSSPWRAQVVITKNERHKKRLVIDYSQTINRFTTLNAYPLPRIDETVNRIAQYRVFSTIDLKSAYHQVPLQDKDKCFTAFEANRRLYQFRRIPFWVRNGVAAFQKIMDDFITNESLSDTFAYLDDITICGHDQAHHDKNLDNFLAAAKRKNLTYNEDKCRFSVRTLNILGSIVSEGEIRPDPDRLKPLQQLPPPTDSKSLKRVHGMFSYYSQWIKNFSEKIRPLINTKQFPLNEDALDAFKLLKDDVEKSVVGAIDERLPFEIETDASEFSLAATLNQNGRPVAFFTRMLNNAELKYPSIEKEAAAIIEAIRKWKHYLTGKHFVLITDQQSVAYMFDKNHGNKIKNDKIMRWRIELSTYDFDIIYRSGDENVTADTLSRIKCMKLKFTDLYDIHNSLCHPGVARMAHFVRVRNLPFSVEDVKRMTASCKICCECKPRYYTSSDMHLIKATQPFERLNLDFKGPLPTQNQNKYILTVVDEFSRFPFAFPCKDVSTASVIEHLRTLFGVFGMPSYVHSDRGSAFMSAELKSFLHEKGIAASRTTSYNPAGNGLVEKMNGTIWKAVILALKSHRLPVTAWQEVLSDALNSIRSLLCTSTNCTPHERLFTFQRKSTSGTSIPSWMATPGPILLKRFARASKFEPLVDEVELIEANPRYARVRFSDGTEDTVSNKRLAPSSNSVVDPPYEIEQLQNKNGRNTGLHDQSQADNNDQIKTVEPDCDEVASELPNPLPRRSQRARRPPDRLTYYHS